MDPRQKTGRRAVPRWTTLVIGIAAAAIGCASSAGAQTYPTRTVSLIVPYPPGGGVDAMARVVAEKLSGALGQQVVVDNRAGGSGLVGTRAAARSTPDGHTLFLAHTGSVSINPSLYANAGFDPRRDFVAIGLIATMSVALLAHPSFPAKTVADVVAIAKREGSKLNIGSSAIGTGSYLSAELFKSLTNTDATIIPYKGTAQLMNDLLGGHVPIAFGVLPPALGNVQAGTLRAIAVLSPTRSSLLPDVPTSAESGLPGFEASVWYAMLAPAGTPADVVARLNAAGNTFLKSDKAKELFEKLGVQAAGGTPADLKAFVAAEIDKWGPIIKAANISF
jgi:tripartite-type tricarboxylate transporter receptor subunit TctC